jgi:hypothetical protein
MLSNILREKNFNVRQLSHTVCHKAHGHDFGTFLGVYFTGLCFKLNNLTGQKGGLSKLKLSWLVTATLQPLFCTMPELK